MAFLEGITRGMTQAVKPPVNPGKHSSLRIQNRVKLQIKGPDGEVKAETPWMANILTTLGLASLASRVGTASGANVNTTTEFISAMKIGTSTVAATSTDAALGNSTGSVTIGNASFTKSNLAARTVEYQATFASNNPAGAAVINEVGIYLNSTADTQIAARSVLGTNSVNKGASDTINVSYQLLFTTA